MQHHYNAVEDNRLIYSAAAVLLATRFQGLVSATDERWHEARKLALAQAFALHREFVEALRAPP